MNAESRGTNSQEEDIYIEINIEIKFLYKSQVEGQRKVFLVLAFFFVMKMTEMMI